MSENIPYSIIGLIGKIFPNRYTQSQLDSLFLRSGAPVPIPDGSKATKVAAWLRQANRVSDAPLNILAGILDDFMEKGSTTNPFFLIADEYHDTRLLAEQSHIRKVLADEGLALVRGGKIVKSVAVQMQPLEESIVEDGLVSLDTEIKQALGLIEQDRQEAAQYAGNLLKTTLKAYLDHKGGAYSTEDALVELWNAASKQMGLSPQGQDGKDLKKIASGLNSMVDGMAHLRKKKSTARGNSEQQPKTMEKRPQHARLVVYSAHTVAGYVLELMERSEA